MASRSEVIAAIADTLKVSRDMLALDYTMKDSELWDSLAHMNIIAELENLLAIELTIDEITEMVSVGQIFTVIQRRGIALSDD